MSSRQADSIKRQVEAGGSALNIVIPASAKSRLEDIAESQSLTQKTAAIQILSKGILLSDESEKRLEEIAGCQSLTPEETLEKLINQGIVEDFLDTARAREMWNEFSGDGTKATNAFWKMLKLKYPRFKIASKLPEHSEAVHRYGTFTTEIFRLRKLEKKAMALIP